MTGRSDSGGATVRHFTLGYPKLSLPDRNRIEGWRKAHDPAGAARAMAHFTLAFGHEGAVAADYLSHVAAAAARVPSFEFCCRRVVPGQDPQTGEGLAFLVPDEGNSRFFQLHDLLHTALLENERRFDLGFQPHLTVGRAAGPEEARRLCDRLNAGGIAITGRIAALAVVAERDGQIEEVASFGLSGEH